MSIAPVISFPPTPQPDSASAGTNQTQAQTRTTDTAQTQSSTVSGASQKQPDPLSKTATQNYELPQDVVELHQDPDIKDQIIFQFLDQSKNLILQVPSNEELNVERGIVQEFQQEAKLRAAVSDTGNTKGNAHGD
jgi:hypothetical protein